MLKRKQTKISTLNNIKEDYKYKVSIIVPCYNTKPWLDECLQSLVDQTLQEIEIICINDGSTDGTGERLDEWQAKYPSKIKVIHQKNSGLSNTRNTGMVIAQGECIGLVDSDDFVDVCMYEKIYDVYKYNNADIVKFGYLKFNDTDIITVKKQNNNLPIIPINPIKELLEKNPLLWNALYKKTFLQKHKINFLANIYCGEDFTFTFDITFNFPKVFKTSNIYYYYRQNRVGQLTLTKSKVLYDIIKIHNYIENKYIKICLDEEVKKYLITSKLCQYTLATLKINKQYKKDFLFKCANSIFNSNYKTIDIYKFILTNKYKKYINYLLGAIGLTLFHCCYLWQKLPFVKVKNFDDLD